MPLYLRYSDGSARPKLERRSLSSTRCAGNGDDFALQNHRHAHSRATTRYPLFAAATLCTSLLTAHAAPDSASNTTAAQPSPAPVAEPPQESHPGISVEANYAEAVLAFNQRDFKKASELLTDAAKAAPKNTEVLELLALSLKILGKEDQALSTYEALLQLKSKTELAPYQFETGTIYFKKKRFKEAKVVLEGALSSKFNEIACHFFLGLIEFNDKNFKNAEGHFNALTSSGTNEYAVAAHFYLGLLHFQNGYGSGGTSELLKARNLASKLPGNPLAEQISQAAQKTLAPYDSSQWFANLSLMSAYDSNAALYPDRISSAEATGKQTLKGTLIAGFGRMSSPLRTFQWIPGFRLTANKNSNAAARELEFFSAQPTFYLNLEPLSTWLWGLKAEGNYTFQNRVLDSGSTQYQPFSLTGDFGPTLKIDVSRDTKISFEVAYRPQRFDTDLATGSAQRTGYSVYGKLSLRNNGTGRFFRPDGGISFEALRPNGTEFRGYTVIADFTNQMQVSMKDTVTGTFSLNHSQYPEREGGARTDYSVNLRGGWLRPITPKLTALGDLTAIWNRSSVDELFTYSKISVSLGISYSL